jgi:outer membrane murein-binding lipoprotein Lpp
MRLSMSEHLNGYRLLRNLMVGVLIGLCLNIPLSIWWAGVINTKVDNNTEAIKALTAKLDKFIEKVDEKMDDRYRGQDAKDDFKIRDVKIEKLERSISSLTSRVARLEP